MRKLLPLLSLVLSISFFAACSDDSTQPPPTHNDGMIHGQINNADFEYDITPGDPGEGPFVLRGRNLHYSDDDGALVVDLSVVNLGQVAQHEPIGLTFIQLDPDGVTLLNPDNDIHDDGAAIVFHFANDDGQWTSGEESLPRTVEFGVDKGASIAFVARLELGGPVGGTISGVVWNDADRNGVRNDNEPGLPGIDVFWGEFAEEGTQQFGRVATDANGHYVIGPLSAGGYVVTIAPSTVNLFPTTPAEIHVILVETDDGVSSYRGANFGAVPNDVPPPPLSEHLHAVGKFAPPDGFVAASAESFACADTFPEPRVTDPPVSDECIGGRLRGSVTELAPERNAFRVMATWVIAINGIPADLKVGSRVDVHVRMGPGPLAWVVDSIAPWIGDLDEITGRVEAVEPQPDGTVRLRVLNTWVSVPGITNG